MNEVDERLREADYLDYLLRNTSYKTKVSLLRRNPEKWKNVFADVYNKINMLNQRLELKVNK